jgi:hypothetical protein
MGTSLLYLFWLRTSNKAFPPFYLGHGESSLTGLLTNDMLWSAWSNQISPTMFDVTLES